MSASGRGVVRMWTVLIGSNIVSFGLGAAALFALFVWYGRRNEGG